eukprot:TRINITY_DN11201_c0_g1_i6.p2 TRINITY_DN11201_c0_g1~~TRINITY_DN11201_c0_g1_i6.p2  ORF type:complete len:123 (-),score=12.83 TRINITY_DN11201_c0_g1_i6:186-554(-)
MYNPGDAWNHGHEGWNDFHWSEWYIMKRQHQFRNHNHLEGRRQKLVVTGLKRRNRMNYQEKIIFENFNLFTTVCCLDIFNCQRMKLKLAANCLHLRVSCSENVNPYIFFGIWLKFKQIEKIP